MFLLGALAGVDRLVCDQCEHREKRKGLGAKHNSVACLFPRKHKSVRV